MAKTTAVARAKVNLPAAIQAEMASEVAELSQRLSKPTGASIRYSRGRFKLPDGTELDTLDTIIVDFAFRNRYYADAYDPDTITPPDCFAVAMKEADLAPVAASPNAQNDSCKECPQNKFKSAANGKGKACSNSVIMAVLPPDADASTELMLVTVPATSLAYFNKYASQVAVEEQLPLRCVVSELSTDPSVEWSTVRFHKQSVCTPDQMALAHSRREEARAILLAEPDFTPAEEQAKPAKKPAARARR